MRLWIWVLSTDVDNIAKGRGPQAEEKTKLKCLEIVLLFTYCLLGPQPHCSVMLGLKVCEQPFPDSCQLASY